MLKTLPFRTSIFLLLLCAVAGSAFASNIETREPVRLPDGEPLKVMYYFPHWWEPWKSDDAVVSADMKKMKDIGFNAVSVDHEVSQAVAKDWYWLDREYRIAAEEGMHLLPWLQLQSVDRNSLMKFSHLKIQPAVNQDGKAEDECADLRDPEFRHALADYISAYLDRYGDDPALLKVKDHKEIYRVLGLVLETGWRNSQGQPLGFDDNSNAYFCKWMQASYYNLKQLNQKWGTNYKSFADINPRDKSIFDYGFADKANMPLAVREHSMYRARMISEAFQDVAKRVRKRHKNILLVAEIAYPLGSDNPNAQAFRWNDGNEYKAVDWADMILVRGLGDTCMGEVEKQQDLIMAGGKKIIYAYRLYADSTTKRAAAVALDCAISANGLAYYNWNEAADNASAVYNKPDTQVLLKLMNNTYDMLCDPASRHDTAVGTPTAPADTTPATVSPAPVVPAPATPATAAPEAATPAPAATPVAPAEVVPALPAPTPAAPAPSTPAPAQ